MCIRDRTKVAKAINVTFQQIQKYEKGTNGVSSIRLLQLANYLKVPINYFFEDFSNVYGCSFVLLEIDIHSYVVIFSFKILL